MSDFGIYRGDVFLQLDLKPKKFIIDGILRSKDTLLFVGDEKAGKSLFINQMICSLTSQHPFLDKYAVREPIRVSYVQLEGELSETQDRIKRMIKYVNCDPELFQILFMGALNLESAEVMNHLHKKLEIHAPQVLIIDPLYQAMTGSLSDDISVRRFISNVRLLKDRLNCAVIIVHHTHKLKRDYQGFAIAEGDEATFGSKFLKAYPDHTILFSFDKATGIRTMTCATQRTGDIEKHVRIRLVEPDPLYFEEIIDNEDVGKNGIDILSFIDKRGPVSREDVEKGLEISSRSFWRTLKKIGGKIEKTSTRPPLYSLKCDTLPKGDTKVADINGTH